MSSPLRSSKRKSIKTVEQTAKVSQRKSVEPMERVDTEVFPGRETDSGTSSAVDFQYVVGGMSMFAK